MIGLVFKSEKNELVTSSKLIAVKFNKRHADVLRAIYNLECSNDFIQRNFALVEFQHDNSVIIDKEYLITRDGFSFLAMGFTGKEAARFKEDFISAFNQMEKHIKQQLPATYIEALEALLSSEKQKAIQQTKIAELQPKADVFDVISSADNLLSMNDAAKSLKIGRNKLMDELRQCHILQSNNMPYQRYIDSGYFKVIINPIKMGEKICDIPVTRVTAKGLTWLGSKTYFI